VPPAEGLAREFGADRKGGMGRDRRTSRQARCTLEHSGERLSGRSGPTARRASPLLSVVQDAYLAGVGTPGSKPLVDALGSASLSTSEMGRIRAAPVAEVVAFRVPASGCTVAALTGGSAGT
jgi:hypothetical protein